MEDPEPYEFVVKMPPEGVLYNAMEQDPRIPGPYGSLLNIPHGGVVYNAVDQDGVTIPVSGVSVQMKLNNPS